MIDRLFRRLPSDAGRTAKSYAPLFVAATAFALMLGVFAPVTRAKQQFLTARAPTSGVPGQVASGPAATADPGAAGPGAAGPGASGPGASAGEAAAGGVQPCPTERNRCPATRTRPPA